MENSKLRIAGSLKAFDYAFCSILQILKVAFAHASFNTETVAVPKFSDT